ncbi:MAG: DUF1731 domain-containing protein [Thermoanaerobaculia bacterium]
MPHGARAVRWQDGSDSWRDEAGIDGAAAAINLVGEPIAGWRWSARRKREIVESRVRSVAVLVDAIRAATYRPAVLLQSSAVGFYGDRGDERIVEESRPGEGSGDDRHLGGSQRSGRIAGRPTGPAAHRAGALDGRRSARRHGAAVPSRTGARLGSGRQWMPWIHIEDEIEAIAHLLGAADATGPFNLSAPGLVTNAGFTRALARALHRPALFVVPAFALRWVLGEMAILVLGGQRAEPQRLLESGFRFRHPELGPALADLFAPLPSRRERPS